MEILKLEYEPPVPASNPMPEADETLRRRLSELAEEARRSYADLERHMMAAKDAERQLFKLLFQADGLKQPFPSELLAEANRVRAEIRTKVEALATRTGYPVNPRFETDGEVNLGAEGDFGAWWSRFHGYRPPMEVR